MDNAVIAAYTGTNEQKVEIDFEKKRKTNPRTQTRKPQPSPTQQTNQNPKTTPNWYAKFVERWDIQPETVITGIRVRQHTEASCTLNSQRRKINRFKGISYTPTIGSTIQTKRTVPRST